MAKAGEKISKKLKPDTELQEVVHQWILATHEFNAWRHQLRDVLDSCTWTVPQGPYIGDHRVIVRLRLLDEELMEMVRELLNVIKWMEERNDIPLDQLVAHTNTIYQWTQKIRSVLSLKARGAA